MIDRLPPNIANFNKRLLKYTLAETNDSNTAPVTLHFQDGSQYEADLLLGADGIKSAIRPQMLQGIMDSKDLKPQFTRTVSIFCECIV